MKKYLVAALIAASCLAASADQSSCQFQISRHSGISCQFSNHPNVVVVPSYPYPPAWTQSPVFTNPPTVYIYQEPQVIYVQPQPIYIAPGTRIPDLPYQPNPYIPYYNPNPYPRHR